ncbi:hypothetical protein EN935_39990, partial [Mesorhizobium sp. M7D.F.Ca.US.004.03.1.1]|uniref:hypothetical protein n=1 Tax=Mesorhizobium sp. M7D.F.Ca.US.004.03.1.1 TaxID=2496702 RepID=UPI000FD1D0EB
MNAAGLIGDIIDPATVHEAGANPNKRYDVVVIAASDRVGAEAGLADIGSWRPVVEQLVYIP